MPGVMHITMEKDGETVEEFYNPWPPMSTEELVVYLFGGLSEGQRVTMEVED